MNQVNVGQRVGLVIDFVMGMIRYMVLTFAAMILMVVIAQKKSVLVAELKLLLDSRKVKSLQHWLLCNMAEQLM